VFTFEKQGEGQDSDDHPWLHMIHHVDRILQAQFTFLDYELAHGPPKTTKQTKHNPSV
jgi:hypothetical protein